MRLLHHTTRKVSLTAVGKRYLQYRQEPVSMTVRAEKLIPQRREIPGGKLKIIAPPGFMCRMLSALHHHFPGKYLQVEPELTTTDSFSGVVNNTFDITCRIGKPGADSFIGCFPATFNRFIVGAPG